MLSCGSKWCLWGHVGHTMFSSATPMVDCCSSSNIKHPGKFFLDAMVEPWPTGRSLEDIIHPLDLPKGHDKACMTSCRPDHRYVDSASIRFGINIPWYFSLSFSRSSCSSLFQPTHIVLLDPAVTSSTHSTCTFNTRVSESSNTDIFDDLTGADQGSFPRSRKNGDFARTLYLATTSGLRRSV